MSEVKMSKAERAKMQKLEATVTALAGLELERQALANETPRDKQARETKEETVKRIVADLEELGGKLNDDDDIVFYGTQLVIPETMSVPQTITFLERHQEERERETSFGRTFLFRPWDGAWCMWQVMKRSFGAVGHRGSIRYTMFGAIEDPPQMISIATNVGETEQVPWGRFGLPFLPGVFFETEVEYHAEYGALFRLNASGPKKHRFAIEGVFTRVQEELESNSLYRGKAFDGQEQPEFMDVWSVDRDKVVYSEEVQRRLEANVWSQLRYTEQTIGLGIKLKRAVLIHGPFGTGKTLAAMLTGQEALAAGWTFIKARPGKDNLVSVLQTARLYQPCVVFYEDLDTIAAPVEEEDRPSISRLLDVFDGFDAKGTRILCVLTTNFPEKIHKGMIRPGRLDAEIEIDELDQQGIERLVKVTIPEEKLDPDVDWAEVYESARDYKPAFVTEFADRSMRYALVRTEGQMDGQVITTEDLCMSARELRTQYERMEGAKTTPESESLGLALDRRVKTVVEDSIESKLKPELLTVNSQ